MEELFKQNLLRLRQSPKCETFGEALFPNPLWNPVNARKATSPKVAVPKEGFSEKKQVLESLERFAHEKAAEIASPVIKIEGGEVVVKPEPSWDGINSFTDTESLKSQLSLESNFLNILFQNKSREFVRVIFVTETFRKWSEVEPELKEGFINELLTGFPSKTAELFLRMITAMKLDPNEVVLYPVEGDEKNLAEEVMSIAGFFQPEVIITLGAKATQKILKSNDRLSLIHGQFFQRNVGELGSFQVVPLFHPSIIETNQNMKKTAWTDMQKIMKHLKKLT
jgi:hypothetical protein